MTNKYSSNRAEVDCRSQSGGKCKYVHGTETGMASQLGRELQHLLSTTLQKQRKYYQNQFL